MYHELTDEVIKRRRRNTLLGWAAVFLVIVAIAVATVLGSRSAREQGAQSMKTAILRAASQCCATEGSYPTSLHHLEKNYGLVINREDYVVTYEAFAGNLVPTVVVVPR